MGESQEDRGCGGSGGDEAARPGLTSRLQLASSHLPTSYPPPTHGLTCMLLMHPETPAPPDLPQQPTFSEDLRQRPPHVPKAPPIRTTSSHHPKVLEPVATSAQPYPLLSPVVVGGALSGSLKPGRASARVSWIPPPCTHHATLKGAGVYYKEG